MNGEYYNVSVSLGAKSADFPKVSCCFSRDDDGHGYTARVEMWPNGDAPDCLHELWIRQGMPLGSLWIAFDGHEHGAWATAEISGGVLSERDLEWAANWAVLVMKNKHSTFGDLCKKKDLRSGATPENVTPTATHWPN